MSKTLIKEGVVPEKKTYQFTCNNCGCVWTDDEPNGTCFWDSIESACITCGKKSLLTIPLTASVGFCGV